MRIRISCLYLNALIFTFVDVLQAEEMAKTFRQRVAQAEAAARAEELRLQQEVIFLLAPKYQLYLVYCLSCLLILFL